MLRRDFRFLALYNDWAAICTPPNLVRMFVSAPFLARARSCPASSVRPVSYTHLDVYKRQPLKPPQETAPGHKFFDRISDGFLTKDDFVTLYDGSAEVLHCRNPYAPGDSTINVKYTVDEWSRRIKLLLGWHFVQIVDVKGLWVVQVPDEGPIRGFFGAADGPFVVEPLVS